MKTNLKTQTRNLREGRMLSSAAFRTTRSRVLGMALLAFSAASSYAGNRPVLDGDGSRRPKFSLDLQQRSAGANDNDMVTVIVQYRQMPNTSSLNAMQS